MKSFVSEKRLWPEWVTLALFAVALALLGVFHEPWFDEAQAWQIAKCASLREILFEIPHYEGHPPLWHLILCVPAKLGVPYEWGLKGVGWLFGVAAAAVWLFRAPFPRMIKLLVPFTYFCFYQYSVIVRPYGLMMLALFLAADAFRRKDEKPWPFGLCLLLLCLTSAYGIVLAGGVAAVWQFDILQEKHKTKAPLFPDRRLAVLPGLLLAAFLLIIEILPAQDTFAAANATPTGIGQMAMRLVVLLFSLLPESAITSTPWFSYSGSVECADVASLLSCVLLTGLIILAIGAFSAKRHFRYFLVPFLLFTLFSSAVYLSTHHVGIIWLFLLFWVWSNQQAEEPFYGGKRMAARFRLSPAVLRIGRGGGILLVGLILLVSTLWSVLSSVSDIRTPYAGSRSTAAFLKENGLDKLPTMMEWRLYTDAESPVDADTNCLEYTEIMPYFDDNFVFNYNGGDNDKGYFTHQVATDAINQAHYEQWRKSGVPDVLIGEPHLGAVYGDEVSFLYDYAPVYQVESRQIWKGASEYSLLTTVYLKRTLLEEYHLQEVEIIG